MPVVDAHVHLGVPFRPAFGNARGYTPDDLLRDMDIASVDMTVIMGIPHVYDNEYTAAAAEAHPDRLIPWAYVDPWHHPEAAAAVKRFAEMGFLGIKFRAVSLRYSLSDRLLLDPWLPAAEEHGLHVSVHTGDDPACTPLQVQEMAQAYPGVTFLMCHAGFRTLAHEALAVAQRCPNIVLDQTAATSLQLYDALEQVGSDRIVYGSDAPFMDTRVELKRFETAINDPDVYAACTGGNILRILGKG